MDHATKIICIAAANLVAVSSAIVAFSGIPYYVKAKNLPTVNYTADEWEYSDKGTFSGERLSGSGLSLISDSGYREKDGIYSNADGGRIIFSEPVDMGEVTLDTTSIGGDVSSWYELYDMMYGMTLEDCNITSRKQAKTFYEVAEIKDTNAAFSKKYRIETEHGIGFADLMHEPDEEKPGYIMYVSLFDRESPDTVYGVMISDDDLDSVCRMVNSVDIDK